MAMLMTLKPTLRSTLKPCRTAPSRSSAPGNDVAAGVWRTNCGLSRRRTNPGEPSRRRGASRRISQSAADLATASEPGPPGCCAAELVRAGADGGACATTGTKLVSIAIRHDRDHFARWCASAGWQRRQSGRATPCCDGVARMILPPGNTRVWLATGRTDMGRGMNSLALQVHLAAGTSRINVVALKISRA